MKRKYLRAIFTAAIFLIALMSSITVFGATKYKYKTIKTKPKKWVTVKDNKLTSGKKNDIKTVNMYQIKVKSPGYLTITWKRKKGESDYLRLYRQTKDYPGNNYLVSMTESKTIKLAIGKGTYYLADDESSDNPRKAGKFRYIFKSVKPTANYSPGTAKTLAPGKKVTICLTPEYEYSRWYKITLPKKNSITFWCERWTDGVKSSAPGYYIELYDSDFNTVNMEHAGAESTKYFSSSYQDAGTYYIRVESSDYSMSHDLITLKWK